MLDDDKPTEAICSLDRACVPKLETRDVCRLVVILLLCSRGIFERVEEQTLRKLTAEYVYVFFESRNRLWKYWLANCSDVLAMKRNGVPKEKRVVLRGEDEVLRRLKRYKQTREHKHIFISQALIQAPIDVDHVQDMIKE